MFTSLQSFSRSLSSYSSPCRLMAHQVSPSLSQSPPHLETKQTRSAVEKILNVDLEDACSIFLPSPSSVRVEDSCFLFLLKGSTKLRLDEPPQAEGLTSLSIFPPQVTLRLGIFKDRKCQDCNHAEKFRFIQNHIYPLNRNQVGTGDDQFG